jgi:hypothetical protein
VLQRNAVSAVVLGPCVDDRTLRQPGSVLLVACCCISAADIVASRMALAMGSLSRTLAFFSLFIIIVWSREVRGFGGWRDRPLLFMAVSPPLSCCSWGAVSLMSSSPDFLFFFFFFLPNQPTHPARSFSIRLTPLVCSRIPVLQLRWGGGMRERKGVQMDNRKDQGREANPPANRAGWVAGTAAQSAAVTPSNRVRYPCGQGSGRAGGRFWLMSCAGTRPPVADRTASRRRSGHRREPCPSFVSGRELEPGRLGGITPSYKRITAVWLDGSRSACCPADVQPAVRLGEHRPPGAGEMDGHDTG